ncbi:MAG: PBP1A family penicillin-binding protein [Candidatus Jorgensenbacteria bacterium]|nr:PBP1A family penicillin-binding protein [Candidatus Jorgensenbacteria bacterium]
MTYNKIHLKRSGRRLRFFFWVVSIFVAACAVFALYLIILITTLPSPAQFSTRSVSQSTKLYDRTGKTLLYEIFSGEKRTIIPFNEIPEQVKLATLAAENVNFYNEPAISWRGMLRALYVDVTQGQITQGGSTITQQLVKTVLLTPERTVTRKIKEVALSIELESKYSKEEIFFHYLNQIPYGSNAYGVEAASQIYFNKSVKDLTLAESAILASLIKAPSYYSPWGDRQKELFERQQYILKQMKDHDFISAKEYDGALKEKVVFIPQSIGSIQAPHFSFLVKDYLINQYGEYMVMNGGLRVMTTLDANLEKIAEKAVEDGAKRNEELYSGTNAALVAQDPKTGQILAYVGSRDYFNDAVQGKFNLPVQGLRQPGSALKPFVYLTAFQKGYTPQSVVFDVPTEFDTRGNEETSYKPENFDEKFIGPVALQDALAQSRNVPAVKVLYLAGIDAVINNLKNFGITTLKDPSRYGLSLTLGGGEVKLMDLISAYATLSQEGIKHEQKIVLKVEDSSGNVLEEYNDDSKRVIDPEYPRIISKILSNQDLRAPIFTASLPLTVFPGYQVALKTGTSQDYRDAWAFGYTPSLAIGVWAGNNDNKPMKRSGSSILAAVPIWNSFLSEALLKFPSESFTEPDQLPLPAKPMLNGEYQTTITVGGKQYPQIHSILYYVDKNDPLGPVPSDPGQDPQFYNWELGMIEWARANLPNFFSYNISVPKS